RRTSGTHRLYPWLVGPAALLLVETERPIDAHDPDHGRAWLSLVNPGDGRERWRVPLFSDLWLPTAEADGGDIVLHAEKSGRTRFFDPATGQERAGRDHPDDRGVASDVTVGGENTYACSETGLVRAVDRATGALAWYAGFAPFCPPLYVR